MNIIYLHCHDAGRYLSPYGAPVQTPHLEHFASDAVLFRQAHCAAPTCSPSRAALLTGESAHQSGMLGLRHRGFSLLHPERHLAYVLKEHGYRAYLSGVQHVFDLNQDEVPYEKILAPHNPGTRMNDPIRDRKVAEAVAAFLAKTPPSEGNIWLECGFFFPHRTFPETDPGLRVEQLAVPCTLPDQPEVREDVAGFHTAVTNMDAAFGLVWDALQKHGWLENSLIFFTTDHGIPFPKHKCQLADLGTGVALLVRPPGGGTSRVCDQLVSHLDVYPTICDYAQVEKPDWLQGASLRGLLEGRKEPVREELFAEVSYHAAYEPKRSVRTDRFKFIRNYELSHHPALANIDGGQTKEWMLQEKLLQRPVVEEEFFDLWVDPEEANNLIEDPRYASDIACLRQRLDHWMQRTDDPLLRGKVAAPVGAQINQPGSLHPSDAMYTVKGAAH